MPRVAGQIDLAKTEAILDAAGGTFAERGLGVSMEEIARRACVSKQTIYNHYGSKAELVRALVQRRVHEITSGLEAPGAAENPREALADFGRRLLQSLLQPRAHALLRLTVQAAGDMPDVSRAMYEAGPRHNRQKLAEFIALEARAGRLSVDDPAQAAEFFAGMVLGSYQTAGLLGVDRGLTAADVDAIASEAAARFMRAYAP